MQKQHRRSLAAFVIAMRRPRTSTNFFSSGASLIRSSGQALAAMKIDSPNPVR